MARTTTSMGLRVWNLVSDVFNHTQLADNWDRVDAHDHTGTKGVQIPAGGLATNAVTSDKILADAVTTPKIANLSVTTDKLAANAVTRAKTSSEAWTEITTFSNGWTNYGGGFATAGYFKDNDSVVWLKGLVQPNAVPVNGSTMFTLPVGYRPGATHIFCSFMGTGVARIDVATSGAVYVTTSTTPMANTWHSLENIRFRAV